MTDQHHDFSESSDISDFDLYQHAALCEAEFQQLDSTIMWDPTLSDEMLTEFMESLDTPNQNTERGESLQHIPPYH